MSKGVSLDHNALELNEHDDGDDDDDEKSLIDSSTPLQQRHSPSLPLLSSASSYAVCDALRACCQSSCSFIGCSTCFSPTLTPLSSIPISKTQYARMKSIRIKVNTTFDVKDDDHLRQLYAFGVTTFGGMVYVNNIYLYRC